MRFSSITTGRVMSGTGKRDQVGGSFDRIPKTLPPPVFPFPAYGDPVWRKNNGHHRPHNLIPNLDDPCFKCRRFAQGRKEKSAGQIEEKMTKRPG